MMTSTMLLISLLVCSDTSPSTKFSISCTMRDTQLSYHREDAFARVWRERDQMGQNYAIRNVAKMAGVMFGP